MGRTLAHRGPDGRRTIARDSVALGHALMRVNAEDVYEAQPIADDALILVADVRLDNRDAIAAEVGIDPGALAGMPDSLVLLAGYRHWGEACLEHLIGDFAFALWDGRTRSLLLARDPMGQRGVFYHHGPGIFAFASEVKALWAIEDVPRVLSETAIGQSLLAPVDPVTGATLYEGISVLPGGTMLRLDADGVLHHRTYWAPHAGPEHLGRDEAYYVETYRRVLEEAVACRVRRLTRAPGLLFSGGFDSGSIAALAGPVVASRGRRIVAVSSLLAPGARRAVRDARAAIEAFRGDVALDLHEYVRGDEGIFTNLEGEFAATGSATGTPYVRRGLLALAAAGGARLVMDGHGGDYTVNVRAPAMLGRILRRGHVRRFVREFGARRAATGRSRWQVWREDVLSALLPLRLLTAARAVRRGFVPLWRTHPVAPAFAARLFAGGAVDPLRLRQSQAMLNRWESRWRHLLAKASAAAPFAATLAAGHGLDFSRPFHDPRVVEFALAIPESLQFKHGLERHLARQALADRLPPQLLARGPGNDAEEPDLFRMANRAAPGGLAEARRLDRDGRLSRYVDFAALERMIAHADESKLRDHRRLHIATRAIAIARFVAWFDRSNA